MALITFANQTGNIPLADLDSNFSAVNAFVSTAGVVVTNNQPNITSVGTLTSLSVAGSIATGSGITGASLTVTGNATAGNLNTGGIVRSNGVSVNGNVAVSTTIVAQGNITGQYFIGNGSQLTGIVASSSNYSNANVAAYLPTYNGNLQAGNIILTSSGRYYGNGAGITNILGSEVKGTVANATYSTISGTTTATSLPNLTSIGTLNSLNVAGNVSTTGKYLGDGSGLTGISGPAFSVSVSSSQAFSYRVPNGGAFVPFDTINFDTDNCYNRTTNRFTPNVAGYYMVTTSVGVGPYNGFWSGGAFDLTSVNVTIYKNGGSGGSWYAGSSSSVSSGFAYQIPLSALVYMNGTTDFLSIYCSKGFTKTNYYSIIEGSYFQAVWIRS